MGILDSIRNWIELQRQSYYEGQMRGHEILADMKLKNAQKIKDIKRARNRRKG
jgi:hypothetical protein